MFYNVFSRSLTCPVNKLQTVIYHQENNHAALKMWTRKTFLPDTMLMVNKQYNTISIRRCHMYPYLVVRWHLHRQKCHHHSWVNWDLIWYLHECCSFSVTEPKMQRTTAEGFNLINISAQWQAVFVCRQQVGSVSQFISCTACWRFNFLHPNIHTGTQQKYFP